MQASQAAQEAEINARKAKNSVTSLLHLINDLLEQLGKWLWSHCRQPPHSLCCSWGRRHEADRTAWLLRELNRDLSCINSASTYEVLPWPMIWVLESDHGPRTYKIRKLGCQRGWLIYGWCLWYVEPWLFLLILLASVFRGFKGKDFSGRVKERLTLVMTSLPGILFIC